MSRTSPPRPDPAPMLGPAEPVAPPPAPTAGEQIEAMLRAPERRDAAALEAATPVLETLTARAEAVRRRFQAQQAEHGAKLDALLHRDFHRLHILLGGGLAMELREAVESTRGVFQGRSRANGTIHDPSVYSTLDKVARLVRQVTAKDLHRCPPRPPGCGCLIAQIITLVEDAEALSPAVTVGMARIDHLERRVLSALKARGVDGLEETAPPIPSAPRIDPRPSLQAVTNFDVLG